jgi:hypothetical protein
MPLKFFNAHPAYISDLVECMYLHFRSYIYSCSFTYLVLRKVKAGVVSSYRVEGFYLLIVYMGLLWSHFVIAGGI